MALPVTLPLIVTNWRTGQPTPINQTVDLLSFGAIPDGNVANAAVNTAAINAALATKRTVIVPWSPFSYNIGSNVIPFTDGMSIQGENNATIAGTGTSIFDVSGAGDWKRIRQLSLDMNGSSPGSKAILIDDGAGICNNVLAEELIIRNAYGALVSVGTFGLDFQYWRKIQCEGPKGLQFNMVDAHQGGFLICEDLFVDFTSVIGAVSFGAGAFNNFAGLQLRGLCDAGGLGTAAPVYNAAVTAWKFTNGLALWLDTLFADTTIGDGILINNVEFVWGHVVEGSLNLGSQVIISNGSDCQILNLIVVGGVGEAGAAASKVGLTLDAQATTNIANAFIENCTGDGALIKTTSNGISIANLLSINNTGNYAKVQDSADNIAITGGYSSGNGGGFVNTSSGKNIRTVNVSGIPPTTTLALVNGLNSNITLPIQPRVRISGPSGGFSVGGFTGGTDGQKLYLFNSTAQQMTIVNEDGSSTAANRITTLTGANVVLRAGTSFATISYDSTNSRWILESTN